MLSLQESTAFRGLKDINDVEHFDPNDKHAEMANDFAAFLNKWDAWNWLGLTVLHTHHPFKVMEDEVLIEETDHVNRMQIFRPCKLSELTELKQAPIQTAFRFFRSGAVEPQNRCVPSPNGHDLGIAIGLTACEQGCPPIKTIAECQNRCVSYTDNGKGHVNEHVRT